MGAGTFQYSEFFGTLGGYWCWCWAVPLVPACSSTLACPLLLLGLWCWSGQRTDESWEQKADAVVLRRRSGRQRLPSTRRSATLTTTIDFPMDGKLCVLAWRHPAWVSQQRFKVLKAALFSALWVLTRANRWYVCSGEYPNCSFHGLLNMSEA